MCHKSTAAIKIAAAGKPVIFVVPQEGYSNILIESGFYPLVRAADEFLAGLEFI